MNKPGCCAPVQHGFETIPLLDLPEDMLRAILSYVPLRKLAQLACLRKEPRTVYVDRVRERDAEVAVRLESDFTAEFREGLSSAETALPRDLFVNPQMDPLLQAAPEDYRSLARKLEANGKQYQGFCLAGSPDGHGRGSYGGANTYVGEFRKGRCQGWGSLTSADGSTYVGQWHASSVHGQGTYTWSNGDIYQGEWDMGDWHGYGTYTYASGEVYAGQWVAGKRHGQGCEVLLDGERYEGEFKFDERDGLGYVTYPDGSKLAEVWTKGIFGASSDTT